MMAKHLVKCLYCHKTFDANEEPFVKPKANRYAHKSCADSRNQEDKDRDFLEQYIKELFGIDTLTTKIKKQIDDFHGSRYNFSYSGMYKTLKYFFEIRGNSLEKSNGGIGIIPWVYDEAFMYWRALWEAQQQNKDIQLEEFVLPVKEIHIEPPQREPMKHMRPLFTFLNEEEDLDEE